MKQSPIVMVAVAVTMLSLPAIAEDGSTRAAQDAGFDQYSGAFVDNEVDTSLEASRARLNAEGYREVRQVNGDALGLAAFDPQGSEVLLAINPQSGGIDTTEYVHPMDE